MHFVSILLAGYDPKIIEQFEIQQPTCLPLSYVLRFFANSNTNEEKDTSEAVEKDANGSKLMQTLLSPKAVQQKINPKIDLTSELMVLYSLFSYCTVSFISSFR